MRRLFVWFVSCLWSLFFFSAPAHAVTPIMQFKHKSSTKVTAWYNSRDELCAAWTAWATGDAGRPYECVPPQTSNTYFRYRSWNTTTGAWNSTATQDMTTRMWCADGSTPDTSKPLDQQCADVEPPNPCEDKNPFIRRWNYPGGGPYSAPDHYGQCVVVPLEMLVCRKDPAGGSYCMWMVKRTGQIYEGTNPPGTGGNDAPEVKDNPPTQSPPITNTPSPDKPPGPCPAGTSHAGSDSSGIPICIGSGSQPPAPKPPPPKVESEKNEQMPDGSTKNTQTTTQTNSDGSTTTTTTVTITAPDGTKTTTGSTDVSNTPTGQPGRTDTNPEDEKYDLCKQNPNLSICRESSVSGSCGQVMCQGDAIQCATLRAAAAMQCQLDQEKKDVDAAAATTLGKALLSGADPEGSKLPSKGNASVVDVPGTLDKEGWLGGGAPFEDLTFELMGSSITIPFAKWSGYLIALRYALMMVAALYSFRIVSGAVRG